ncbi:MAG: diguanylate cyclase [Nitrosomonadales bacterium]|nr:diguanylate cyclase [Nitrosomonadales bacterium]
MNAITRKTDGHPVLIIGAGRGGSALLEMFLEDPLIEVIAIADSNSAAPGIELARSRGIQTFASASAALQACKDYPDSIVYNMSHDDTIAEEAARVLGNKRVTSGAEVKLFWQMVTNLRQIKNDLERSQSQLQAIIHSVMDGIITIGESGEIQGFNPAAEQMFGYSQQEVLGKQLTMLMPEPDCSLHPEYIEQYVSSGTGSVLGGRRREVVALRKNGEQFPMELSVSEMLFGGQRYFIGIVRDITERKQAEQKIAHLAHYDYLTDLPNRALFLDNLKYSISLAQRNSYKVAVMFLDLDGFKQVNDTLGHEGGDLLLQELAKKLKAVIRTSDTVARVGGDEFVFVLNNVGSREHAAAMANKIIATLVEPVEIKQLRFQVGGSVGIALFPDDTDDPGMLIRQADEAMYQVKQSGKNAYKFYQK